MECLFIIDLQVGFITNSTKHIVPKIEKMREFFLPGNCVFTKFINQPNSLFETTLSWSNLINKQEQDLILHVEKENCVFTKYSYSAVTKEVKTFLKLKNFSKIYLCGVDIDSCVLATAFSLFDIGIIPMFIADCCSSNAGKLMEENTFKIIERSFGKKSIVYSNYIINNYSGGKK